MNWKEKLQQLDQPNIFVKMKIDGYNITYKSHLSSSKVLIFFYIDGVIRGTFTTKDSPIGQKFGTPCYPTFDNTMYSILKKHRQEKVQRITKNIAKLHLCTTLPLRIHSA